MKRYSQRTGAMLIELMYAVLASLLIGAALLALIQTTYTSQNTVMSDNMTYVSARKSLDTLAAHLAQAQAYQVSTSPSAYSALSAAGQSTITCYIANSSGASAGDTEQYWLDTTTTPNTLKRTQVVSGVSTTTVIIYGLTGLTFTYQLTDSTTNYNNSSFSTVTPTTTPLTAGQLQLVAKVTITATVTINNVSQTITSVVRLRNSPYRS